MVGGLVFANAHSYVTRGLYNRPVLFRCVRNGGAIEYVLILGSIDYKVGINRDLARELRHPLVIKCITDYHETFGEYVQVQVCEILSVNGFGFEGAWFHGSIVVSVGSGYFDGDELRGLLCEHLHPLVSMGTLCAMSQDVPDYNFVDIPFQLVLRNYSNVYEIATSLRDISIALLPNDILVRPTFSIVGSDVRYDVLVPARTLQFNNAAAHFSWLTTPEASMRSILQVGPDNLLFLFAMIGSLVGADPVRGSYDGVDVGDHVGTIGGIDVFIPNFPDPQIRTLSNTLTLLSTDCYSSYPLPVFQNRYGDVWHFAYVFIYILLRSNRSDWPLIVSYLIRIPPAGIIHMVCDNTRQYDRFLNLLPVVIKELILFCGIEAPRFYDDPTNVYGRYTYRVKYSLLTKSSYAGSFVLKVLSRL